MAAPYNSLSQKIEAAMVSRISLIASSTLGPNVALRAGIDDQQYQEPAVICICDGGSEEGVKDTGIFTLNAKVEIVCSMDECTRQIHQTRSAAVIDALTTDDAAADLRSGQSDLYVYDVTFSGFREDIRERSWVTEYSLTITACASDVS